MTLPWQALLQMPHSVFLQSPHPNTWQKTSILSAVSALSGNVGLEENAQWYDSLTCILWLKYWLQQAPTFVFAWLRRMENHRHLLLQKVSGRLLVMTYLCLWESFKGSLGEYNWRSWVSSMREFDIPFLQPLTTCLLQELYHLYRTFPLRGRYS